MKVNQALVRNQILQCRKCDLREGCRKPVPFRGNVPAKVAVIGEAPGRDEDEQGKPMVGVSGKYLTSTITQLLNISEEDIFICNVCSCRPPGNRTPLPKEALACSANLRAQLAISGARYVLLAGATALKSFRPMVRITDVRGLPFWRAGHIFVPTYHPAAVLRQRGLERVFKQDITYLAELIEDGFDAWPGSCIHCGVDVEVYDALGIPWCNRCKLTVKDTRAELADRRKMQGLF